MKFIEQIKRFEAQRPLSAEATTIIVTAILAALAWTWGIDAAVWCGRI